MAFLGVFNHLDSYTISLVSLRSFRGPLFCNWSGTFFAVSFSRPALVEYDESYSSNYTYVLTDVLGSSSIWTCRIFNFEYRIFVDVFHRQAWKNQNKYSKLKIDMSNLMNYKGHQNNMGFFFIYPTKQSFSNLSYSPPYSFSHSESLLGFLFLP